MPVCTVCHHSPERSKLAEQLSHYPERVSVGVNADTTHAYKGPIIETEEDRDRAEEAHFIYRNEIRRLFYIAFVRKHEKHNPKWARSWLRSLERGNVHR